MIRTVLQFLVLAVVLLLVQVVLSKVIFFNVAVPIVFIYVILRLPVNLHVNWVLTIAFLLGLSLDVFSNTPGMHALACVVMAAFRHSVFNAFVPREADMSNPLPSTDSLGVGVYLKYLSTLTVVYCLLIFFVQAFTLRDVTLTLLRVAASSVLSIAMMLGIDSLVTTRREKRL